MKTIIITAILFGVCHYLDAYARDYIFVRIIPILLVIGIFATLLASIWAKGRFWQRQIKASKITFPLTAVIYLMGYLLCPRSYAPALARWHMATLSFGHFDKLSVRTSRLSL